MSEATDQTLLAVAQNYAVAVQNGAISTLGEIDDAVMQMIAVARREASEPVIATSSAMRTPRTILQEIAENGKTLAPLQAVEDELMKAMNPYRVRDGELRSELMTSMLEHGDRNVEFGAFRVGLAVRHDVKIVDEVEVRAALQEMGQLDACTVMKLDAAAVKRVVKESGGEPLPGMKATEAPYLTGLS